MKQAIFESSDKTAVIEQANAFCDILKMEQFINTQMNPLLVSTKKTKTIKTIPSSGNETVESETIVNTYSYIIIVSYIEDKDVKTESHTPYRTGAGLSG